LGGGGAQWCIVAGVVTVEAQASGTGQAFLYVGFGIPL